MKRTHITLLLAAVILSACGPRAPSDADSAPDIGTGADPEAWAKVGAGEFYRGQFEHETMVDYDYEIMVNNVTNAQYAAYLNLASQSGDIEIAEYINLSIQLEDIDIENDDLGIVGFYPGDDFHEYDHEIEILAGKRLHMPLSGEGLRIAFDGTEFSALPGSENHPVAMVTWFGAKAYCEYFGGRLPSEIEWEKAARGTDGRPYPWGSDRPDGSQANMSGEDDPYEQTAPVGSFPAGASPYGVMDMTGNAREWVADWYQKDYYANAPSANPPGPESGELDMRVSRGGSYAEAGHHSRTSDRMPQKPDLEPKTVPFTIGFRCAPSDEAMGQPPTGAGHPAPTATTAAR